MAKIKTFMVEVEVTTKHYLLVEARRPNGAAERLQTDEGWRRATAYQEDEGLPSWWNPNTMKITDIREA